MIDSELAGAFIQEHLHELIATCELFGSEKLRAYRYNTTEPKLHVDFGKKIDFLGNEEVSVSIGEERFALFEMLRLYKKHAYIPLSSGEKCIVNQGYIQKLERLFKKEKEGIAVSFFDLPEIEKLIAQKNQAPSKTLNPSFPSSGLRP